MRDFFRPVATLLTGTVLAQGLVYASRPLLTRIFTPEEFGILGFFAGLVAVIASMSGGKYEDALMLPSDPARALSLAAVSVSLSLCTALLVASALPFRGALIPFVSSALAADILILAPCSIAFVGIARTCEAWLTRTNRFDLVAKGRVVHSSTVVPTQMGTGLAAVGAFGLVGGLVLGQAVQSAYYGVRARTTVLTAALPVPTLSAMIEAARRYRRFAIFGAPGTGLNTASVQLPALLLLFFFDASVLGNYGLGYSVLAVPMALLGSAVAQVYYVRATEALRLDRLADLTAGVFRRLVAIGLFPILCVAISGPEVFRFVFGPAWSSAGQYAAYLSPWVFLVFISSPLSRLFDLLEKQKELLLFNCFLLVVRAGALVTGGVAQDSSLAILLFGAAGAAMWLIHTVWMLRLADVTLTHALKAVGRCMGTAILPIAVVFGAKLPGSDVWATAGIGGGAVLYYALVYRYQPGLLQDVVKEPS